MSDQKQTHLATFASMHWYNETTTFLFNVVAKTSKLFLVAGIVVNSANFTLNFSGQSLNRHDASCEDE